MCGIAGFLSRVAWTKPANLDWLDNSLANLEKMATGSESEPKDFHALETALHQLAAHFAQLMSFSTHLAALQNPLVNQQLQQLATTLETLENQVKHTTPLVEILRDYAWQIRTEVLANIHRTLALLPPSLSHDKLDQQRHFIAWAVELVLENLDRLEVRGRDSAGIALHLVLDSASSTTAIESAFKTDLDGRGALLHGEHGSVRLHTLPDGRGVCQFIYKVANLIGKLGDNGKSLRNAMQRDALLWAVAQSVQHVSILAHTRWASNGIINLANCHPVNASLAAEETISPGDAPIMAVLNGDVDNYQPLVTSAIESRGYKVPEGIRTDAKIIPLLFRLDTPVGETVAERVLATVRRLEGSIAVGFIHPDDPEHMHLVQRGSGQSLFIAQGQDGWLVASEAYGLAARARNCFPLLQVGQGGVQVTLSSDPGISLQARLIDDAQEIHLIAEPIEIFSRDIFRGDYDYYLEKEIHEAPMSIRKTLQGRYQKADRRVSFMTAAYKDLQPLIKRLQDPALPPLRRIIVTGQGTASVAAMGTAYLIQRALHAIPMVVEWAKASELSTQLGQQSLKDTLVIAISQSGTTTDTNRTVDLARADGAWVHAILNRRNSPLVRKSDSRLFTSDGRDVEMAVASTKAFYSQVVAGKLTALCLGEVLNALDPAALYEEILAVESLPERITEVLANEAAIAACASAAAPYHRYWAVVGSGPNKIAAEEIRIKLSELCYRSIPCDFTEDKKHIDLSTEPLTLVIANDLLHLVAQDTAKEVAIFKAHSGKPIVFAATGEHCFEPYAETLLYLPSAGAGLDFVIATVAGHLWGLHAAKAIDASSVPFREAIGLLSAQLDNPPTQTEFANLRSSLAAQVDRIAQGTMDAALPARLAAQLSQYLARLNATDPHKVDRSLLHEGVTLLKNIHDELSRPIDTIRHQAKTVTVGISRPQQDMAPVIRRTLSDLDVSASGLADRDKQLLITLSPFIAAVAGGALYRLCDQQRDWHDKGAAPTLQIIHKIGCSAGRVSHYDEPRQAAGSKRRTLRLGRAILSTGAGGQESLLLLPVFDKHQWLCEGLALLHLEIIPQASLQQKLILLKGLGQYEDALETFQDHKPAENFAMFLETLSPHDLIFMPSFRVLINPVGRA